MIDPWLVFLIAKMAVAAAVVVGCSLLAERFGPLMAAMIATLPISAGPVYVFLALEHDAAFLSAGVKELWTFDRDAGELIVETAERRTVVDRRDEHESPLLPGFRLPVGRIFEEAREYGSDAD